MVFVTGTMLRKGGRWRTNFIDQLRVFVKGGSGGQGYPSHGGVGGDGGNVYVKAVKGVNLKDLRTVKRFSAEVGENSRVRALQGEKGKNVTIKVPVGVCIMTDDNTNLGDLNKDGQEVLVTKGGKGGYHGNKWYGEKGRHHSIKLVLKLLADVGLVGFPNAGKSTLLQAMSRSQPKIADYPFTTIRPQIGIVEYQDQRQISLADLPGLIEGAHLNYGMGHQFLRHVERTKLLLFVVDVHGFRLSDRHRFRNAVETVLLLNRELKLYKPELLEKPAILALNKIDVTDTMECAYETRRQLLEKDFSTISEDLLEKNSLVEFEDVVMLSAKEGQGLDALRDRLRTLIDELAEKEKDNRQAEHG